MMESLFLKFVNVSITAGWLVLAIILFRIIFKKAPKAMHAAMWALVGIRLLCPVSFESIWSFIPSAETVPEDIMYMKAPAIQSGVPILNSTVNPILESSFSPKPWESANPLQILLFIAAHVWVVGIVAMLLYMFISYLRIRKNVREAVNTSEDLWVCDQIDSPFILGVIRPRIYVPSNLSEEELKYVVAHERAHLKRLDHIWKPLGFLILAVYWFHPVLWIAYVLLCRDIEFACDEKVVALMGEENKKSYSMALLNCSVSRKTIAACPLAFGEVGVKGRIKSILHYKKPAFWLMIIAILTFGVLAMGFLTNPVTSNVDTILEEKGYKISNQEECEFAVTIPKDVLTEAAYTSEGQSFGKNDVIVYETETTNVYLEKVMLSNESDEWLYFAFDFSYHDLNRYSSVLLPYEKTEKGFTFSFDLKNEDLSDDTKRYDKAVSMRGQGPEEAVWIYASKEVIQQAQGNMTLQFVGNELYYEKTTRSLLVKQSQMNERLESFVNVEVAKHFETEHSKDKYRCMDVEVLGVEEKGTQVWVYAWIMYKEYSYDGEPVLEVGAHIPTAICAEKVNDYYELVEYWEPEDGNRYAESIKEKFPAKFHKKALDSEKYAEKQAAVCQNQMKDFYAVSLAGKTFRGEEVVYGHRLVDSFFFTPETIPVFALDKANLHLLSNDYPKPSFSSAYYDIGQIQSFDLTIATFDSLLNDEFEPWEDGYSAEKLREENKNAYFVNEEGQEYNRFYYLLEQKNGDIYVAYGPEGQSIRYIFKMYESIEVSKVEQETYVAQSPDILEVASFTLFYRDQTFSFSTSTLSSFLIMGNYEVEDGQLILNAHNTSDKYVFDIHGNNLYFNQKKSTQIQGYHYNANLDIIEYPIEDGTMFRKVK